MTAELFMLVKRVYTLNVNSICSHLRGPDLLFMSGMYRYLVQLSDKGFRHELKKKKNYSKNPNITQKIWPYLKLKYLIWFYISF